MRATWCAVVVTWCAGCATTPRWAAATTLAEEKFPARAEVQRVLQRPGKLDVAKLSAEAVDAWTLAGPFPEQATVTPVQASTPWERALVTAAPGFGRALSEDHRCIAREVARFLLAKQSYPGHSLQRFIELRCATTAPHVRLHSITGEVPKKATEAEWLAQWKDDLVRQAQAVAPGDLAGLAALREGDRAVLVLATGDAGAVLARPVPLAKQGLERVEVRGRLARGGAFRIGALINQGPLDAVPCKTLDAVSPPEFAFECEVKTGDTRTVLELAAFDEGRILGREVLTLALWPTGAPRDTWSRPKGSADVPAGLLGPRFVAAVNALRTKAGLAALQEAPAQSATATGLAPHYFLAAFGKGEPLDADLIALAMMAGWDVGVDLVSAGFGSNWLSGTRDLSVFMEFLLDSPYSRKSLTEPRATHLAVGPVEQDGAVALGALFATYVPLGTFDRKESEIAIITRLNTLRRDRGLPLAQWTLWPEDEGALIARHLASRRWSPQDASQHALDATAAVAKGRVTGYVQLVDDLENFQFPPEVLLRPDINVFLAVGTYRGEEWAHSRYVVCFVLAQKGDIETAAR